MTNVLPTSFLRQVMLADAAASAACGTLMLAGGGALADILGLPPMLLRGAGLALLPYALLVAVLARRPTMRPAFVWAVILCNAAWVVDSLLLLLGGWASPTMLGSVFVIAQAAVVALFAELQVIGLKRSTSPA
jgi:hypothetical protein